MRAVLCLIVICLWLNVLVVCADGDEKHHMTTSGECDTMDWELNVTARTLIIIGKGRMCPYSADGFPWARLDWLEKVVFEGNVTSIADYAFNNCFKLSNIIIPSTVISIGREAFRATSLKSITIPESVSDIHSSAFAGCSSLSEIRVNPKSSFLKDIDGVLFTKNESVLLAYPAGKRGQYKIPSTVLSIYPCAFSDCAFLTSVIIPEGVRVINFAAFHHCTALTRVSIPRSVIVVGDCPFRSCTGLKYIDVVEGNLNYLSDAGVLISRNRTQLIQFPCGRKGSYTIPDGVTQIKNYAFYGTVGLSFITIPRSVRIIESGAFDDCSNIEVISYLGENNPCVDVSTFHESVGIRVICVSTQYKGPDMFCGKSGLCRSESCDKLQYFENHCYQATCELGILDASKRKNATILESKSNECVEYGCDNTTGLKSKDRCISAGTVCVENHCVVHDEELDKEKKVEITIEQNDEDPVDLNTTKIIESICNVTGMRFEYITVETTISDNGVITLFVFVDDDESAKLLNDAVSKCIE